MSKKVILDTNVLISALAFDKICENCILICLEQNFEIYFSLQTQEEWLNKVYHGQLEKILQKSKRILSKSQIDKFIKLLKQNSQLILKTKHKINICRDPKDNMFLELAKECQADFIVSGDKDLLALENFENTKILKPSQFLDIFDL